MKKHRGYMDAVTFYRHHVNGDIVTKNDVQYYRGSIVKVEPDDEKKQKLVSLGILIVPKIRKCLQCDREFESYRNMRVCNKCKSFRGEWHDDGNTYYESY